MALKVEDILKILFFWKNSLIFLEQFFFSIYSWLYQNLSLISFFIFNLFLNKGEKQKSVVSLLYEKNKKKYYLPKFYETLVSLKPNNIWRNYTCYISSLKSLLKEKSNTFFKLLENKKSWTGLKLHNQKKDFNLLKFTKFNYMLGIFEERLNKYFRVFIAEIDQNEKKFIRRKLQDEVDFDPLKIEAVRGIYFRYHQNLLSKGLQKFKDFWNFGVRYVSRVVLPKKREKIQVLRSPHVNKKSMESFTRVKNKGFISLSLAGTSLSGALETFWMILTEHLFAKIETMNNSYFLGKVIVGNLCEVVVAYLYFCINVSKYFLKFLKGVMYSNMKKVKKKEINNLIVRVAYTWDNVEIFIKSLMSLKIENEKTKDLLTCGIPSISDLKKFFNLKNWELVNEFDIWWERFQISEEFKKDYYEHIHRRRFHVKAITESNIDTIKENYGVPESLIDFLKETLNAAHVDSSIEIKYWSHYDQRALESHLYSLAEQGEFSDLIGAHNVKLLTEKADTALGLLPFDIDTPNEVLLKDYLDEGGEFCWYYFLNPDVQDIIKFIKYREFLIQFFYDNNAFPWENKENFDEMLQYLDSPENFKFKDNRKWYDATRLFDVKDSLQNWYSLQNLDTVKSALNIFNYFESFKKTAKYYTGKFISNEKSSVDATFGHMTSKSKNSFTDFLDRFSVFYQYVGGIVQKSTQATRDRVLDYKLKQKYKSEGILIGKYDPTSENVWYKNLWDSYTLLIDRIIFKMFLENRSIKVSPQEIRDFMNKHSQWDHTYLSDDELQAFIDKGGVKDTFANLAQFDRGMFNYYFDPKRYSNFYINSLEKINYIPMPGRHTATGDPSIIMFKWKVGQALDCAKLKFSHVLTPGDYLRTIRKDSTLLREREAITFDVSKTYEAYASTDSILRTVRWMEEYTKALEDNNMPTSWKPKDWGYQMDHLYYAFTTSPRWLEKTMWDDGLNTGLGMYLIRVRAAFFRSEMTELWYPMFKAYLFVLVVFYIDIYCSRVLCDKNSKYYNTFGKWYMKKRMNIQLKITNFFGVSVVGMIFASYSSYIFMIPTKFIGDDHYDTYYRDNIGNYFNEQLGSKDDNGQYYVYRGILPDLYHVYLTTDAKMSNYINRLLGIKEGNFGYLANKQFLLAKHLVSIKLEWKLFVNEVYRGITQYLYRDVLDLTNYFIENLIKEQRILFNTFYFIWTLPERCFILLSHFIANFISVTSFLFFFLKNNFLNIFEETLFHILSIPYYIVKCLTWCYTNFLFSLQKLLEEVIELFLFTLTVFRSWKQTAFKPFDPYAFTDLHKLSVSYQLTNTVERDDFSGHRRLWQLYFDDWYWFNRKPELFTFSEQNYWKTVILDFLNISQDFYILPRERQYGIIVEYFEDKFSNFSDYFSWHSHRLYVMAEYYIIDCIFWCLKRWSWSWIWANRAELMFYAHNEMGRKVRKFARVLKHYDNAVREYLFGNWPRRGFLSNISHIAYSLRVYPSDWFFYNTWFAFIFYPFYLVWFTLKKFYWQYNYNLDHAEEIFQLIRNRVFSKSYFVQIFFVEVLNLITMVKIFYFYYIHTTLFYPFIQFRVYINFKGQQFFDWIFYEKFAVIFFYLAVHFGKFIDKYQSSFREFYQEFLKQFTSLTNLDVKIPNMDSYSPDSYENKFTEYLLLKKEKVSLRKQKLIEFQQIHKEAVELNSYQISLLKNYLELDKTLYHLDEFPLSKEEEALDKAGLLDRGLRNIIILDNEKKTPGIPDRQVLKDMKDVVSEGMFTYSKRIEELPKFDYNLIHIPKDFILDMYIPQILITFKNSKPLEFLKPIANIWIRFWSGDIWWDIIYGCGVTLPQKYTEFKYQIPVYLDKIEKVSSNYFDFYFFWLNYFVVYVKANWGVDLSKNTLEENIQQLFAFFIDTLQKNTLGSNLNWKEQFLNCYPIFDELFWKNKMDVYPEYYSLKKVASSTFKDGDFYWNDNEKIQRKRYFRMFFSSNKRTESEENFWSFFNVVVSSIKEHYFFFMNESYANLSRNSLGVDKDFYIIRNSFKQSLEFHFYRNSRGFNSFSTDLMFFIKYSVLFVIQSIKDLVFFGFYTIYESIVEFLTSIFNFYIKRSEILVFFKEALRLYKLDLIWVFNRFLNSSFYDFYIKSIVDLCSEKREVFDFFVWNIAIYFKEPFLTVYNVDILKVNFFNIHYYQIFKTCLFSFFNKKFYVELFYKVIDLEELVRLAVPLTFFLIKSTLILLHHAKVVFYECIDLFLVIPYKFSYNYAIGSVKYLWFYLDDLLRNFIGRERLGLPNFSTYMHQYIFVDRITVITPKKSIRNLELKGSDDISSIIEKEPYMLSIVDYFKDILFYKVHPEIVSLFKIGEGLNRKEIVFNFMYILVSQSILIPKYLFVCFLEFFLFRTLSAVEFVLRFFNLLYDIVLSMVAVHLQHLSRVSYFIFFEVLQFGIVTEIFTGFFHSITVLKDFYICLLGNIFNYIRNLSLPGFFADFYFYFTYIWKAFTGNYWWNNSFISTIYTYSMPFVLWLEYNLSFIKGKRLTFLWEGDFSRNIPAIVGYTPQYVGKENTKIATKGFQNVGLARHYWAPIQNKDLYTAYGYLIDFIELVRGMDCPATMKMDLTYNRFVEIYLDCMYVLVEMSKFDTYEDTRSFFILTHAMFQLEKNLFGIKGYMDKVDPETFVSLQGFRTLYARKGKDLPDILDFYPEGHVFKDTEKFFDTSDGRFLREADEMFKVLINNRIPNETKNNLFSLNSLRLNWGVNYIDNFFSNPENYIDQELIASGIPKLTKFEEMFSFQRVIDKLIKGKKSSNYGEDGKELIFLHIWREHLAATGNYATSPIYGGTAEDDAEEVGQSLDDFYSDEGYFINYLTEEVKKFEEYESSLDYHLKLKNATEAYEFAAFNQKIYNFYRDMCGPAIGYQRYHFPGQSFQFRSLEHTLAERIQFIVRYICDSGSTMISNVGLYSRLVDMDFSVLVNSEDDIGRFNNYFKYYLLDPELSYEVLEKRLGLPHYRKKATLFRGDIYHRIRNNLISFWEDYTLDALDDMVYTLNSEWNGIYENDDCGIYKEFLDEWDTPSKIHGLRVAFEVPYRRFYKLHEEYPDWKITSINQWDFFKESTKFRINLDVNPLTQSSLYTHLDYHINYFGFGQFWEIGVLSFGFEEDEFYDNFANLDWKESNVKAFLTGREVYYNRGFERFKAQRLSSWLDVISQDIEGENLAIRAKLNMRGKLYNYWVFYDESDKEVNTILSEGLVPLERQIPDNNIFGINFYDVPTEGQYGFQDPASPIMEGIIDLHHDLLFFLIAILTFVFWAILNIVNYFVVTNFNTRNMVNNKVAEEVIHTRYSVVGFQVAVLKFLSKIYNNSNFLKKIVEPALVYVYLLVFDTALKLNGTVKGYLKLGNLTFSSYFDVLGGGIAFEKFFKLVAGNKTFGSRLGRLFYNRYAYHGTVIKDVTKEESETREFKQKYAALDAHSFPFFYYAHLWFKIKRLKIDNLVYAVNVNNAKEILFDNFTENGKLNGVRAMVDDADSVLLRYEEVYFPKMFTHNTTIEVVWTIIPAIILIFIAIPSFSLLYAMDQVWQPMLTVKVIGNQWYWGYEYS